MARGTSSSTQQYLIRPTLSGSPSNAGFNHIGLQIGLAQTLPLGVRRRGGAWCLLAASRHLTEAAFGASTMVNGPVAGGLLLRFGDRVRARMVHPIAQPDQPRIECLGSEPSHGHRRRWVTAVPTVRPSIG
jgi:hypothetical protein